MIGLPDDLPASFGDDEISRQMREAAELPAKFKALEQALELERAGREQDHRERLLPLAWKRKCNGKLYGLDGVHVMFGQVMVWLRLSGTNKGLHLPLKTLARCYEPVDGYKAVHTKGAKD